MFEVAQHIGLPLSNKEILLAMMEIIIWWSQVNFIVYS